MRHTDKILETKTINSVFLGDALSFSKTAMALVEAELPCISSLRASSLDALLSMEKSHSEVLRMIIVDELIPGDLTKTLARLQAAFPATCIALAYRQPDIARKLLGQLQSNPACAKIGFLPMNTNIDCWLSILRLLASGERYAPVELFAHAGPNEAQPNAETGPDRDRNTGDDTGRNTGGNANDVHLTDRELEVLKSAAAGKQNKIIADDLKLSQHTVKLHMHHIIAKLGVNNRTEAANWFHGRKPSF